MNFIKVSADEVIWTQGNVWQVTGHSDFYLNVNQIAIIRDNTVLPFGGDVVQVGGQSFKNFALAQGGAQAPQLSTI
jgi:3-deoxy-D-arabino-heptulosonate 7-phosphate (DAHP) synthase